MKFLNSQTGASYPRIIAALFLGSVAVFTAMLSFAATPPSGTLTDQSGPLKYSAGPFFFPNAFGNSIAAECDPDPANPLVPCDVYQLRVELPPGYLEANPKTHVFVRIEWPTPAADFDLYLWDAKSWTGKTSFPTGSPIASSVQTATNFEQLEIAPDAAENGEYVVQVSTTLPAGQSFSAKIFLAPATQETGPGEPPGNASGIPPRFQRYIPTDANGAPSSKLGVLAGEPTIFANPKTGSVFYLALYEVLKMRFDDSTSPAKVKWEPKDTPTNISTKVTLDPLLLGDPETGRIWAMQLSGGQSVTDYSDDDGETWKPTLSGGFASGVDHQGIGVGPYPKADPLAPLYPYPNALYYCSQDVAVAFCSRSNDGGLTYGPSVPIYDSVSSRCVGLHGHPKIGPDGTVYVPNKGCGLDTPVIGEGLVNVVVSEDGGITWEIRAVPDSTGGLFSKGDPSVDIDKDGTVYLAYQGLSNNHQYVAVSKDRGKTWAPSVDVGALGGINYSVFPAMVAGDGGRAAVAFFGSTYNGKKTDYQSMGFPGVWHLYVATTYDSGKTWFVANTTPGHPVQGAFAGIGNGGDNRNHYDFIDAVIDKQGRVLVSHEIGCAASCPENGGPNTFQKLAGVVRQSGGRRMYAEFDPQEPAAPAAPLINGYRTALNVVVNWEEPDGSGHAVTGYNVYRKVDGGAETKIKSGFKGRQLVDKTDAGKTYAYRVTALNSLGEGTSSNVFAPKVGQNAPRPELSCTLPGQVYEDRTTEGGTFPNNDIASFSIAEPKDMPGKLVFVINNAHPELTAGANSEYYVFFDPASGDRTYKLSLKDMEVTYYKNGQYVTDCGTPPASHCRDWKPAGPLDPLSGIRADGSVWLVIDKEKFGIQNGDVLMGVFIREDTAGNPSGVIATDYAGGRQDYTVVGNDFCAPARLANISTRVPVRRGDGAGIAGFIIEGSAPKRVILRGIGPSLKANGQPIPGRLRNPVLELRNSNGALIAQNDDWRDSQQQEAIQASGVAPSNDRESAIIRRLEPGAYTAILRGANNTEGIALAEVYELDGGQRAQLVNISTRGPVETGDNVLIGGFILRGNTPAPVLLRAIGPSLKARGVEDALEDPTMELRDANGALMMANDNWKDDQQAAIAKTGIAPKDDREAAILRPLGGGNYTAIVRGKNGTGIGLVEAYRLSVP